MGFEKSSIKCLLFSFNFLCLLAGLVLIFVGAFVLITFKAVMEGLGHELFMLPAIAVIFIGSIVFILAFLGCYGSVSESHCMLRSYAWILCFILFWELVIGVLAFSYRNDFGQVVKDKLTKAFEEYSPSSEDGAFVDLIQDLVQCCGLNSPEDWAIDGKSLPQSCCDNATTIECTFFNPDLYVQGCLPKLEDIGVKTGNTVGWAAIAVGAVEVFGIIFGCTLANSLINEASLKYYVL